MAVSKLTQAQDQAKASARQLYLSNKQLRVLEVNAEDLAAETEKQHRVLEVKAADLATENKTKLEEHRARTIVFERRLASLQQELVTANKGLEISAASRRVQGEMHKRSQRQQSRTHTRQLEEKDQLALSQLEEKDQELRTLKCSSFRDLREKEKEITELRSQITAVQLKLDLNNSDINYMISVAVKDAKAKEREHFKQIVDGKRTVIRELGLERIVSCIFRFVCFLYLVIHRASLCTFENTGCRRQSHCGGAESSCAFGVPSSCCVPSCCVPSCCIVGQ